MKCSAIKTCQGKEPCSKLCLREDSCDTRKKAKLAGLVAAASLLIDYVLTVAVSISAGVQNLAPLFGELSPYVVPLAVVLVVFITLVNLRGVRESGAIFAIPTYIFIGSTLLLIGIGSFKVTSIPQHLSRRVKNRM